MWLSQGKSTEQRFSETEDRRGGPVGSWATAKEGRGERCRRRGRAAARGPALAEKWLRSWEVVTWSQPTENFLHTLMCSYSRLTRPERGCVSGVSAGF